MKKPKIIKYDYKNISEIFNGKSNYLKNLAKRRNDGIKKIKEKKREIFFDDYFNLNKFKRDYSCFSFDNFEENIFPVKFHISKNINIPKHSKIDKNFSLGDEDFPLKNILKENNKNIYLFPKRKIHINYSKNNLRNRKQLSNVGNQIISPREIKLS